MRGGGVSLSVWEQLGKANMGCVQLVNWTRIPDRIVFEG